MSANANRDLVQRFLTASNAGRLDAVVGLVTEDFCCEDASGPGGPRLEGRYALLEELREVRAALPDVRACLLDAVFEDDRVAFRIRLAGHLNGTPWHGHEPDGSALSWDRLGIWRIRDGRLAGEVRLDGTCTTEPCPEEDEWLLGTA